MPTNDWLFTSNCHFNATFCPSRASSGIQLLEVNGHLLACLIIQNNHPTFNSSMPNNFHANSLMCSLYTLHLIVPGPVCKLRYKEDTDTSVNISWKPPKEPNGDIVAYFVEHGVYQNESTTTVRLNARRPKHAVIRALGKLLPFHIVAIYVYWAYLRASII